MQVLSRFLTDEYLWIVGLTVFILMVTVRSLAERIRRRRSSAVGEGVSQAGEGLIATAVVGLLSLLVAFTFSLALSRHELRRTLVVEEANAIAVAYMRAQMLDAPYRSDLSNIIVSYAQVRRVSGELWGPAQMAAQKHSEALQGPLWQRTAAAARASQTPALANALVQSITRMIEVQAQRKAALDARIPPAVHLALMAYAVCVAGILGYVAAGAHGHRSHISWVLFMLIALAFMMILDLDRPADGAILVDQSAMEALVASLAPAGG